MHYLTAFEFIQFFFDGWFYGCSKNRGCAPSLKCSIAWDWLTFLIIFEKRSAYPNISLQPLHLYEFISSVIVYIIANLVIILNVNMELFKYLYGFICVGLESNTSDLHVQSEMMVYAVPVSSSLSSFVPSMSSCSY